MASDAVTRRLWWLAGELVVPVLLLGYATHYYLEVRALPRPETNLLLIEPVYVILLVCCVLFAAGRAAAVLRAPEPESDSDAVQPSPPVDLRKSVTFVVLTLLYVGLIPVVGFVVTTSVFIVALSLALGVRSIPALVLAPAMIVALLYLGMERWLNLPLPKGLLI